MRNCSRIVLICMLTLSAVISLEAICDDGACCKNGILLSNEAVCRPAANQCDVPDYCTGSSSECPLDIGVQEGTPCGVPKDPGICVDGFCWNSVVKAKVNICAETCSSINGNCSQNGTCVCYEPWKNPPYCNIKDIYTTNKSTMTELYRDMKIIDNITAKRLRRSSGNKHRHHHGHNRHHSDPGSHHHKPKALALPRLIQDPPSEDILTKYSKNPLFVPILVTLVAVFILVVFGVWATVLYRSDIKARKLKERIRVHRSRRKATRDTSIINDPSVTIDVGQ